MFRRMLIGLAAIGLCGCAAQAGTGARSPLETTHRAPGAMAAAPRDLLDHMVGRWVLTGEIAGAATTHDVEATWVLQGKYVRVTEVSRERDANGLPAYEATIFVGWLESANRYVCLWLDNTEVASGEVTCLAPQTGDAIPFEFRDDEGALIFTNTFSYDRAHDTWQWRMVNTTGGREDVFGVVTLTRP